MQQDAAGWPWWKIVGLGISSSVVAGGIIYVFCADFLCEALWERAYQISVEGMVPQQANQPKGPDKHDLFKRSSIAVLDRMLITVGWSVTIGLLAASAVYSWSRRGLSVVDPNAMAHDLPSRIEEFRINFVALADEINKARPSQTKTDRNHELTLLRGQVASYKWWALKELQEIDRNFPGKSKFVTDLRDATIGALEAMDKELDRDVENDGEQRLQLKCTAQHAYGLADSILRNLATIKVAES